MYNLLVNATRKPLPLEPKEAVEAARKARRDEVKKWYDEYWKVADMARGSRYSLQLAAAAMDFFKDDKEMFDPSPTRCRKSLSGKARRMIPR